MMEKNLAERVEDMMIERKRSLATFGLEEQAFFIKLVISKMAQIYGGYHHFWEEGKKDFMLQGWRSGLCSMTPYQVMKVLNYVLEGKHKYTPRPPRTSMEFLDLRKDVNLHNVPSIEETNKNLIEKQVSNTMPEQRLERTPEELSRSKSAFDEMRKVLGMK